MDEQRYLAKLRDRRVTTADGTLHRPDTSLEPAFAYGHLVGVNHGLRLAEELLLEMLRDDKEQDKGDL